MGQMYAVLPVLLDLLAQHTRTSPRQPEYDAPAMRTASAPPCRGVPLGLDMAQVVDHDGAGLERAGAQLHVFEDGVARVPRLHGLQARALRQLAVHGLERHVAEGVAVAVVAPVALAAVGVDLVLVVQSLLVTVVVRVAVALGARSRALWSQRPPTQSSAAQLLRSMPPRRRRR